MTITPSFVHLCLLLINFIRHKSFDQMRRFITSIFALLFIFNIAHTQNTVGLLSYDPMNSYDGYNLIFPHNQPNVYLLDNCGEIVHTWTDEANFRPANMAYLQSDGRIIKAKRDAVITGDAIWAGGGGETIEIRDWDNTLLWTYTLNDEKNRLHHDIAPMPNGNILAIAWEAKTKEEAIAAGRDTAKITQGVIWSDWVLEIDPSTNEIVWEWHAWDHLIQDFDSTKANYGVVADHPERIDINYDTQDGNSDWLHANSIDFSFINDQILLSIPHFDEIWIIDHTTTTEQAASSSGGFSFRGGDLMFRWGNPKTYRVGDETNQKLFFQHDAHFIDDFVSVGNQHYNSIGVFNNRVGEDFSTVNIIDNTFDMYTYNFEFDEDNDQPFAPSNFDLTLAHPEPQKLYSTGLSSMQLLPNDNFLLTSGRFGYSVEITPDNEIVWEYKTPIKMGNPATQGDTLAINNNLTFRMDRYPPTYDAFDGRDLSPKGYIELEPDTNFCALLLDVEVLEDAYALNLYPNPAYGHLAIEWDATMYTNIEIYNSVGQRIQKIMRTGGKCYIDVSAWNPGYYFVVIEGKKAAKFLVQR